MRRLSAPLLMHFIIIDTIFHSFLLSRSHSPPIIVQYSARTKLSMSFENSLRHLVDMTIDVFIET